MSASVRTNIAAMAGYQPGEQPPAGATVIKLNTNENPYPPSPRVAEAIRAELDAGAQPGARLRLYSDPHATELVRAASEVTGVPEAGILAGNGSDELLAVLARAYLAPGDAVAFPYPTYVLYETLAHVQDAVIRSIDFPPDYRLPRALFGVDARLVFVPSPNSPTGTVFDAGELRELADSLPGGVLVVDEAYAAFAGQSAIELVGDVSNLVVVQTLSKSHSLAGMRVGLLYGPADLVAELAKVRDSYSLDRLAIVAGAAALRDTAHTAGVVARITASRDRLVAALAALGFDVLPSRANFVFARAGSAARAAHVYRALRDRGILVRYFARRLLDDGIRITVGTDAEVDALVTALRELRPR